MQQELFTEPRPVLIKCPLCIRVPHCGYQASQGVPQDFGGCVNTVITCLHCKADGVISERKELAGDGRKGRT